MKRKLGVKKTKEKAFTLVELISVVIIIGVLMLIAVPSISSMIKGARASTYLKAVNTYVDAVREKIVNRDYSFRSISTTYYVHIDAIKTEKEGKSPYGEWVDAYVVVVYDGKDYAYYWTSVDTAGYKILLKSVPDLTTEDIIFSEDKTVTNRRSVGMRTKIQIIGKDGSIMNTESSLELAREEAKDCFVYQVSGTNIIITGYQQNCSTKVMIPSKIEGMQVTEIGSHAFDNRGITDVIFPNGLVKIGDNAFRNNKITSVTLPSSVITLGTGAFSMNLLTEIVLPATVTSLGGGAFSNNQIPEESAFIYKLNTDGTKDYSTLLGYAGTNKNLVIPNEKEGVPLKTIADSAFRSMGLTSVTIPDTVEYIGTFAFGSSSFTSIVLPSNLKTIGSSAFRGGKLTSLIIPASVTSIGTAAFNGNQLPDAQAFIYARTSSGIDYSKIVSYGGSKRSNVVIPDMTNGVSLKTIGSVAFSYNGLTGITIPSTVTNIENKAFTNNSLPDNQAFIYARKADGTSDYTKLVSYGGANRNIVTIPKTVNGVDLKIITSNSFSEAAIKGVIIPDSVTTIETNAFQACYITELVIPSSVTSIATNAFRKENTWGKFNQLTKIINKTGRSFNWGAITGDTSRPNAFVTGTVDHAGGNITVTAN